MKPVVPIYRRRLFSLILLMVFFIPVSVLCQKKYTIQYFLKGKDTSNTLQQLELKSDFESEEAARTYVGQLPAWLLSRGFPVSSIDSVVYGSSVARVMIYPGEQFRWAQIQTDSIDPRVLDYLGWNEETFKNKAIDFSQLKLQEGKIIEFYENRGYPFAAVSLEDVRIDSNRISARLLAIKGPLYHIDSIRIYGKVKIKNLYLQHYLDIMAGSVYNNQKLQQVSRLLKDLPFLQEHQPWDISMLGTGATLNLYLEPKRSSQINVLIGFVPGNTVTGKAQVTADVHLDLKNSLGGGEGILVNWQQLQPESPRLNLGYTHPYILNSDFGINFSFDLLKRDSSYLQLSGILGLEYVLSSSKTFRIFYQTNRSYLLSGGVDTSQILYSRILPPNIDVRSGNIGLGYHFINTNYRLNPRKGNEMDINALAGIKRIDKNNDIVNLKDPSEPAFDFNSLYDSVQLKSYQVRVVASGAHYFPIGKRSTLKTGLNAGLLQSPQTFQNELFRIGGYNLLRGFDEESIYASRYAVFTGEYRYLVGVNSYFFGFSDIGFTGTKLNTTHYHNSFISGGFGLEFETKFGLLNLSYAVGKRDDVKFDIRNSSKIHFGYINYF